RHPLSRAENSIENGYRNVSRVILAAAESRPQLLHNADHGKVDSLNLERQAERRIIPGKQRCLQIVADHRDIRPAHLFGRREKAALHHVDIANIGHVSRNTENRRFFERDALALRICSVLPVRRIHCGIAVGRLQITVVMQRDLPVVLQLVLVFLAGHAAGACHLRNKIRLAAERLGGALLRVKPESVDRRTHQNHAGNPDDHPEQGEKTAQLMAADRVPGERQRARKLIRKGHFPVSARDYGGVGARHSFRISLGTYESLRLFVHGMSPETSNRLIRPLLALEFLFAIEVWLTFWSKGGGKYDLDLMFWAWKFGLILAAAGLTVGLTVELLRAAPRRFSRRAGMYIAGLMLVMLTASAVTYYTWLNEPADDQTDEPTAIHSTQ